MVSWVRATLLHARLPRSSSTETIICGAGAWTNFAFIAEHGAELAWSALSSSSLSPSSPKLPRHIYAICMGRAVAYFLATLLGGVSCSWVGFRVGASSSAQVSTVVQRLSSSSGGGLLPLTLVTVVSGCAVRACLSATGWGCFPRGFVSDPTNPDFVTKDVRRSQHKPPRSPSDLLSGCPLRAGTRFPRLEGARFGARFRGAGRLCGRCGGGVAALPRGGGRPSRAVDVPLQSRSRGDHVRLLFRQGGATTTGQKCLVCEDDLGILRSSQLLRSCDGAIARAAEWKSLSCRSGAVSLSLSLSLSLFLVVLSAPAYVYARAGGSWFDCSLSHTYIHQPANLQVHVGLNGGAALAATSLLLAHHRRYRVLETAATRIAAQFRACVTRRRSSSRIRRGPTV
jgi:hypothetical protein